MKYNDLNYINLYLFNITKFNLFIFGQFIISIHVTIQKIFCNPTDTYSTNAKTSTLYAFDKKQSP